MFSYIVMPVGQWNGFEIKKLLHKINLLWPRHEVSPIVKMQGISHRPVEHNIAPLELMIRKSLADDKLES